MNYRRFKLLNGNGQEFELTNKNFKVFANDPTGLGFTKTISAMRLGNDNIVTYSLINLDTINFELLFYDDNLAQKYQKYDDFIAFLSSKPIYLLYQKPNSFDWYRRKVESMSLSKSEVERDKMLHCEFVMQTLSFWEDNTPNVIVLTTSEETESKTYPITYPFRYGGEESIANSRLYSKGMLESPLKITIDGTSVNPQYILYDDQQNIYGRGRFNGTFDKVFINAIDSEETIELYNSGVLLDNPLAYQDLTVGNANQIMVTFLKLKYGWSNLRFILGNNFEGSVMVEWRNRYVSV